MDRIVMQEFGTIADSLLYYLREGNGALSGWEELLDSVADFLPTRSGQHVRDPHIVRGHTGKIDKISVLRITPRNRWGVVRRASLFMVRRFYELRITPRWHSIVHVNLPLTIRRVLLVDFLTYVRTWKPLKTSVSHFRPP